MISRAMKSHTNEHTICGRPTLKDVKDFRNRSVCKPYERSIYERTFSVNLSRIVLHQRSYQPGLSTLQLDKKHLQKHHRIFRRETSTDDRCFFSPAITDGLVTRRLARLSSVLVSNGYSSSFVQKITKARTTQEESLLWNLNPPPFYHMSKEFRSLSAAA